MRKERKSGDREYRDRKKEERKNEQKKRKAEGNTVDTEIRRQYSGYRRLDILDKIEEETSEEMDSEERMRK